MARTGQWFQAARGRAMVRKRNMEHARLLKRLVEKLPADDSMATEAVYDHMAKTSYRFRSTAVTRLKECVKRAREAHTDWRKYRQWDAEDRAMA